MKRKGQPLPVPEYNEQHNNPCWSLPFEISIERMDNSMSMQIALTSVETAKGTRGNLGMAIAAPVLILTVPNKRYPGETGRYAIDLRPMLKWIVARNRQFLEPARKPNPRSIKPKSKRPK